MWYTTELWKELKCRIRITFIHQISFFVFITIKIGNDKTLNFLFVFLQSHGNSSIGSEASGVSPPQSTDGFDQDEQHLDQVKFIDFQCHLA